MWMGVDGWVLSNANPVPYFGLWVYGVYSGYLRCKIGMALSKRQT